MIRAIVSLAAKDLALFWRDRACLFWGVGFPILVAFLFGGIFGQDRLQAFAAALAWALIGAAAGFAMLGARERRSGVLVRLRAAPIARGEIVAGSIAACMLVGLATMVVLTLLGASVVGIRPSPGPGIPLAFAAGAICFAGLAILAAQFGRSEAETAAAIWGAMLVLALFGGAILPFAALPGWMQAIGQASPVRWAMLAVDGALWRGVDWRALMPHAAAMTGLGAAAIVLGAGILHRRGR